MKTITQQHTSAQQPAGTASKPRWILGWVIAFVGFPLGGVLATLLIGHLDSALEGILGGAAAGAVIGVAQMLALRQHLPLRWQWIAATSVGMAAGLSLSVAIFGMGTDLNATLLRALLTGLLVASVQWLILRQQLRGAVWWIPAVTLIYVGAWFITAQVIGNSLDLGFVVFGSSGAVVYQLLTGLVLWLLLRERPRTL